MSKFSIKTCCILYFCYDKGANTIQANTKLVLFVVKMRVPKFHFHFYMKNVHRGGQAVTEEVRETDT